MCSFEQATQPVVDLAHTHTSGAHEPPKAAKERVTPVPCKYKFVP